VHRRQAKNSSSSDPYEALQELGEIDDIDVLEVLKCTLNSNSIKRLASLTVKQSMNPVGSHLEFW
jgi:hypothetical protein